MRKKIGECLIQAGLITETDLQVALAEHKRTGERIGAVLIRLELASEKQITKALAFQLGFSFISLTEEPPEPAAIVLIPKDVALKRVCVAVKLEKNLLTVAMSDPLLFSLVQDLEFQTGYRIKQVVATRSDILDVISAGYPDKALARRGAAAAGGSLIREAKQGSGKGGGASVPGDGDPATGLTRRERSDRPPRVSDDDIFENQTAQSEKADAAPIIDLVDLVINGAVASRASDIHIEPMEKGVLVRQRLDGILKEVMELPKWVQDGFVARLKIMGSLDIAEKRIPQDGRLQIQGEDGRNVDFRMSTIRTVHGEKVVLRVLDHRKGAPPLEDLGFPATSMEQLRFFLRHQHGMILVVGPTGSGKSTTLSSAITAIRSSRTNIVTIEDPVEYQIPGVNQVQVNDKAKVTFASSLRAILRQDPDVVLVGEIRDHETAQIAMQAAQTGHLVLSTLHTDDAPSAVTRLLDLKIEPYIIGSALIGVVAQRLVRRLCVRCRHTYTPPPEVLRALNIGEDDAAKLVFYRAVGCDDCNNTGYKGRIGIYEVMRVTDRLRRLITDGGTEDAIREVALGHGMTTMGEDGLAKMKSGITTPEELLRVVTEVSEIRTICPRCSAAVAMDFVACPECGHKLSGGCSKCNRALQPGWNYCPYCTTAIGRRHPRRKRNEERRHNDVALAKVTEFRGGAVR